MLFPDTDQALQHLIREYYRQMVGWLLRVTADPISLFTLALAIFTWRLWRSTEKLWISAERQRKSDETSRREDADRLAASLATTKLAADAAVSQAVALRQTAEATASQATALKSQAELAGRSFFGLERPYVFIHELSVSFIPKNENFGSQPHPDSIVYARGRAYSGRCVISVSLANFGRTPASVDEVVLLYHVGADLTNGLSYEGRNLLPFTKTLASHEVFDKLAAVHMDDIQLIDHNMVEPGTLYVYGFIRYRSIFEDIFIRKFAYQVLSAERLVRVPGSKHNGERQFMPEYPLEFDL